MQNQRLDREAVNLSRNEQQKSVLLIEVAHDVCTTTAKLIADCKKVLAETEKLEAQTDKQLNSRRHL